MTFNWNVKSGPAMRLGNGILGLALVFTACAASASAQTDPKPTQETVETFYLANTSQQNDALEIRTALISVLPPGTPVTFTSGQNALTVRATLDQLAIAQKLIAELDHSKKTYRLSYTITELDAGKRIGTQHFSMVVVSGQRTTLKQGSKVPVATGSYTTGNATSQTQFTYLDVGINLDASIDDSTNGLRLKSKVEQSSIADSTLIADVREPIIRQNVLEGVSLLTLGKPLVLGGIDIPGSTRHLDIDVMAEVVK